MAEPDALPPTIPAALTRAARVHGSTEALVDGDLRLDFVGLAVAVEEAAKGLIAAGIGPGDRVGIWAPNIGEWVVASLAVHTVGAVVVTINTRFKGSEAGYVLEKSGARMLLTVNGFLDVDYVSMLRDAGVPACVEQLVVLRGDVPDGTTAWSDLVAGGATVDSSEVSSRAHAVTADTMSDIIFTSGTTGKPKGAMLAHGASVRAYDAWSDVVGLQPGDRYLIINPFFHCFGLKAGILACLLKGATIVPHAVFDVPSVMQRVGEERITMLPGAPAIYQTILDHPDLDRYDLSTLRLAVTGAATVPVEMIRRMRKELPFQNIVTGYGLTEMHGIATMCRHDDDDETIANTAGRPIPDTELRIVDQDGKDLPAGEPGEVLLRGYNRMLGYFDEPEASATTIDADGWLSTGDIGFVDDRGNLKVTDRIKDMFITGGFNAYPAEIENILMTHPAVGQVAVIGVPDHRMGEVGMAWIVPRPGADVDADEIVAWSREHMANYKVPRRVELVDALPLNASGKVLKFELRDRAASA
jgi:acyl-CoA synthetase (AMP-forming)/AMP-acid ligase II